ncbi:hypothetical protein [Nocardia nova]|uniref:hypothetical protein n=1 Tax=Nocardia nova TaxID=37330 RepID=UPI003409F9CA
MAELVDRLSILVSGGEPVTFTTIALPVEDVVDEIASVAASPMAPFLAEAICANGADGGWASVIEPFVSGLAEQTSVLHLSQTLDALLTRPEVVLPHSTALLDILLGRFMHTVRENPLLASARLNAAVRLSIGRAVTPYRIWECLDQLSVLDVPEDFVEFLPRIVGAALDTWAGESTVATTLRRLLDELCQLDASDTDAAYEIGCDRLRTALSGTDLAVVAQQLIDARRYFVISAAEEARTDADCLIAACDAVLAFSRTDAIAVAEAAARIDQALAQRTAWQLRSHQPTWTRPRQAAEIAWHQLILILDSAADALADQVWMNPWCALDAVLSAYSAARTVQPLGDAPGLAVLIKPAVEDTFLREQHFLGVLERAVQQPDQTVGVVPFDQQTAQLILARVRSRQSRTPAPQGENGSADGAPEADPPDPDRLHRLAPALVRILGCEAALEFSIGLSDAQLSAIGSVADRADRNQYVADDPVVAPLLDRIVADLSTHPGFTADVRRTYSALILQTLLFLRSRLDLTRTSLVGKGSAGEAAYDYRRRPEPGQRKALESDLQRDFYGWLLAGPMYNVVSAEPIDLALGRGDLIIRFGSLRYLAEIKREESGASHDHIEATYLTQAAEYSNTNVPFGLLLVLDLTSKESSGGTWRLDELVWVATHHPVGALTDRKVMVGILPGNRLPPSAYSK